MISFKSNGLNLLNCIAKTLPFINYQSLRNIISYTLQMRYLDKAATVSSTRRCVQTLRASPIKRPAVETPDFIRSIASHPPLWSSTNKLARDFPKLDACEQSPTSVCSFPYSRTFRRRRGFLLPTTPDSTPKKAGTHASLRTRQDDSHVGVSSQASDIRPVSRLPSEVVPAQA